MKTHIQTIPRPQLLGALISFALLAGACGAPAQQSKPDKPAPAPPPVEMLSIDPLAGSTIPVLPLTYLLSDSLVPADFPAGHRAQLLWVDSIIGEALQTRGPEVSWILAPELRRMAQRAPGMVTDPDKMGQALLRNDSFNKQIPDPLRSYLRALNAISEGRHVFVPAAARMGYRPEGARVELTLVLVDSRSGQILWRSHPIGHGPTGAAALADAIAQILPESN